MGLKKGRDVISQMVGLKLYADRAKGEISCQWKPLFRLGPQPGDTVPALSYADANARSFGLDPVELSQTLLSAFGSENGVQ